MAKLLDSPLSALSMGRVGPGCEDDDVLALTRESSLVLALYTMLQLKVNAVAVVGDSGILVSTLSVSNLRGNVASKLPQLRRETVGSFLEKHSKSDMGLLPTPLTCDNNDNLVDVIESMLVCRVHRTWRVDALGWPIGVVNYTDVIELAIKALAE
ncbi:hypothetical protein M885DRAFT_601738 [Pelagophyceae sp. CCMP2097]|nr:hypothetical protein M885DRAFT_601738 [Pelagophyceae sp. CCMP2097]